MSNQRLLSITIKSEVQAINPDGPRKKIHQSIQIKKESINQLIKEETRKPTVNTILIQPSKFFFLFFMMKSLNFLKKVF